jgi:competence protein ComER
MSYAERKKPTRGVILVKVGFIGTGSMGSLLIEAFIRSGALPSESILANNRTRHKVERLAGLYPGLQIAEASVDVAQSSEIIFICVKPKEYKKVLDDIGPYVGEDQIVVSITSPVFVDDLERALSAKIAKIIPSITHSAFSGPSLCIFGQRITPADREKLERLMSFVSSPIEIDEHYTRVSSDLTSCSPAFFSFLLEKMADAAHRETGISRESAIFLISQMTVGMGKLLSEGGFTLETLQQRVAVPGGITADGLKMLDTELEGVFNKLIRTTHAKYEEDIDKVKSALYAQKID